MAGLKIKGTAIYTWIWLTMILIFILAVGGFTFYVVADKGMPGWDYRPVKSLPAQSPYAEYQKLPYSQHVKGKGGQ